MSLLEQQPETDPDSLANLLDQKNETDIANTDGELTESELRKIADQILEMIEELDIPEDENQQKILTLLLTHALEYQQEVNTFKMNQHLELTEEVRRNRDYLRLVFVLLICLVILFAIAMETIYKISPLLFVAISLMGLVLVPILNSVQKEIRDLKKQLKKEIQVDPSQFESERAEISTFLQLLLPISSIDQHSFDFDYFVFTLLTNIDKYKSILPINPEDSDEKEKTLKNDDLKEE